MKAVDTAANRMPIWALTAISFIFVSYIGVLGGVAILSERDVEFFPPKIGSGPKTKLVDEFKEMRKDIKKIDIILESHLAQLYKQLHEARAKKASTSDFEENVDWAVIISNINSDITKYEEQIFKRVEDLETLIKETENKLHGI